MTEHRRKDILHDIPAELPEEHVDVLYQGNARIERIVSTGHASPPGFWYDQDEDEWVMVVAGRARLVIEGQADVELGPGQHILLEAHTRHRVEWTDPDVPTVWLAVFAPPRAPEP